MHKCYRTAKGSEIPAYCRVCPEPLSQEGMFPYLQGTINLKAVSVSLAEHPVCKQHISTFPIVAALTLQMLTPWKESYDQPR